MKLIIGSRTPDVRTRANPFRFTKRYDYFNFVAGNRQPVSLRNEFGLQHREGGPETEGIAALGTTGLRRGPPGESVEMRPRDALWNELLEEQRGGHRPGLAAFAGIVDVGGWLGGRYQRLRFTYTGGFWFDTTEDFSGTQPVGSTLRPDELFLAWLTQCEATWQLHDKLGRSIAEGPESRRNMNLSGLTLVPEVEATLKNFIRYQMT